MFTFTIGPPEVDKGVRLHVIGQHFDDKRGQWFLPSRDGQLEKNPVG